LLPSAFAPTELETNIMKPLDLSTIDFEIKNSDLDSRDL
jgi:hypothetical protein